MEHRLHIPAEGSWVVCLHSNREQAVKPCGMHWQDMQRVPPVQVQQWHNQRKMHTWFSSHAKRPLRLAVTPAPVQWETSEMS